MTEQNQIDEPWVVVDKRSVVGNSVMFHRVNHQGYTCDLRAAHLWTKEDAQKCAAWRETDVAFPYSEVARLVQHHVDCQDLYAKEERDMPHTLVDLPKQKEPYVDHVPNRPL